MPGRSEAAALAEAQRSREPSGGRFTVIEQVRIDYDDGSAIIAPAGDVAISREQAGVTAGDIIDIACKIFPSLCGTKDPGGKGGCYTIIGPDGTTITICPPKQA